MAMTQQQIELVAAAQNGDMGSFEQLYAIYYNKVYGFSRMILKNAADAEDVLQETFITAWRKLDTLKAPPAFPSWLQVIAKNLCNMQLRKKNIAILLDAEQDIEDFDVSDIDEPLPAVYAERADLKERLGRIIDGLSEVQRQAVVLYYFNELSVDEIADIMECSANTVKTRLFLARKAIRSEVEEQESKSGERFYGIVGIPLLPFAKIILSHMEHIAIDQTIADASLEAIAATISSDGLAAAGSTSAAAELTAMDAGSVGGAGSATTASAAAGIDSGASSIGGTALAATKAAGGIALKTKILLGIAAVAVLGAAAALIILTTSSGSEKGNSGDESSPVSGSSASGEMPTQNAAEQNPTTVPSAPGTTNADAPGDAHGNGETSGPAASQDSGEPTSGDSATTDPSVETSSPAQGQPPTGQNPSGNPSLSPEQSNPGAPEQTPPDTSTSPASPEVSPGAQEEETPTDDPGEGGEQGTGQQGTGQQGTGEQELPTGNAVGGGEEEASPDFPQETPSDDPAPAITDSKLYEAVAGLPKGDAVRTLWAILYGFWTTDDYQFAGFTYSMGAPTIEFGYLRSEWFIIGEFVGATAIGDYAVTLTFFVPAQEANVLYDSRDEMYIDVHLDASDKPADGTIKLRIAIQGNGGWYRYTWKATNLEGTW
ncbi:MAG: sigma-70 family RNA polymerase sigma factor [Oscillospiraceae bacterium]|nr:sigma-70 family RNA polymerase sigma factor [Oscillospiraceae bacterium]